MKWEEKYCFEQGSHTLLCVYSGSALFHAGKSDDEKKFFLELEGQELIYSPTFFFFFKKISEQAKLIANALIRHLPFAAV